MSPAPSLLGQPPQQPVPVAVPAAVEARSLLDLMYDGFYVLFLLRNKHMPSDAATLRERVTEFLSEFERGANRLRAKLEDIQMCKYAFCALVDEVVLGSQFKIRDEWERRPLQLAFFGEQLAGEHFFTRLEGLRQEGLPRIEVLEVFHMCLLLGFQGKYWLEGTEKLDYLTARLGDEIAHLRGVRPAFAPQWAAPDRLVHALKNEIPVWVMVLVFGLIALTAYIGLRWSLTAYTQTQLMSYKDLVKAPPQAAHVTITLP